MSDDDYLRDELFLSASVSISARQLLLPSARDQKALSERVERAETT